MQRLDAAIEHFGKAGVFADVLHGQAGFAERLGGAAGGNDFNAGLRPEFERKESGRFCPKPKSVRVEFLTCAADFSRNSPVRNRQTAAARGTLCVRRITAYFAVAVLDHVRADGAFQPGAGGGIIVQRLNLRRARLRERSFGVQHVELRAGAGVGAGFGFTQGFVRLSWTLVCESKTSFASRKSE